MMKLSPSIPPATPPHASQRNPESGRATGSAVRFWSREQRISGAALSLAPSQAIALTLALVLGSAQAQESKPQSGQPTSKPASQPQSQPADQPGKTVPPSTAPGRKSFVALTWPKDKDFALATVDGTSATLAQMVDHVDSRHFTGFRGLIEAPTGKLTLQSTQLAAWARNYASIIALRREAESRGLNLTDAEPVLSEALKVGFERWLLGYRQAVERQGREFKPSAETINQLLTKYQLDFGLSTELQGWLNFLVPGDEFGESKLYAYHQKYGRVFGGLVTVSHILIHTRDPFTGLKLTGDDRKAALRKVEDIRVRLNSDGSNFEEIAQRYSDDEKTASRGGLLRNIPRFDPKLPAIMSRTAWFLRDGEVSGSFESPFGTHFMKRIEFNQNMFPVYTPDMKPKVRELLQSQEQEKLLFEVRRKRNVELNV